MSANDNLLAGLAGFTEGLANGVVPFIKARQQATLEDSLQQRQFDRQTQASTAAANTKFERDQLLNQQNSDLEFKNQSRIEQQKAGEDFGSGDSFPDFTQKALGLNSKKSYNRSDVKSALDALEKENAAKNKGTPGKIANSTILELFPELLGKIDPNGETDKAVLQQYVSNKKVSVFGQIAGSVKDALNPSQKFPVPANTRPGMSLMPGGTATPSGAGGRTPQEEQRYQELLKKANAGTIQK